MLFASSQVKQLNFDPRFDVESHEQQDPHFDMKYAMVIVGVTRTKLNYQRSSPPAGRQDV
jgi:hypothetical protein